MFVSMILTLCLIISNITAYRLPFNPMTYKIAKSTSLSTLSQSQLRKETTTTQPSLGVLLLNLGGPSTQKVITITLLT